MYTVPGTCSMHRSHWIAHVARQYSIAFRFQPRVFRSFRHRYSLFSSHHSSSSSSRISRARLIAEESLCCMALALSRLWLSESLPWSVEPSWSAMEELVKVVGLSLPMFMPESWSHKSGAIVVAAFIRSWQEAVEVLKLFMVCVVCFDGNTK